MVYGSETLFRLLLESIVLGVFFGILYTALPFFRLLVCFDGGSSVPKRWVEHRYPAIGINRPLIRGGKRLTRLLVFAEDLVFSLLVALGILLLAFAENEGRIRWFLPIGILLGFRLLRVLFGSLFTRSIATVAFLSRLLIRYLLYPPTALLYGLCALFLRICKGVRSRHRSRAEARFRSSEEKRLLRAASEGFGCPLSFEKV